MELSKIVERLKSGKDKLDNFLSNAINVDSFFEVAEVIREAFENGDRVIPIGSGRFIPLEGLDMKPVNISQIKPTIEIRPERLTVEVGSTYKVRDLNEELHQVGMEVQSLRGVIGSSIGACIACGFSAPLRFPSRLNISLLGLEIIDNKGDEFFTGRRTLKGVAGYNLNSMYVGSFGLNGVIKSLVIRIEPEKKIVKTLALRVGDIDGYINALKKLSTLTAFTGSVFISPLLAKLSAYDDNPICYVWLSGSGEAVKVAEAELKDMMIGHKGECTASVIYGGINSVSEGAIVVVCSINNIQREAFNEMVDIPFLVRSDGLVELIVNDESIGMKKVPQNINPHRVYLNCGGRFLVDGVERFLTVV